MTANFRKLQNSGVISSHSCSDGRARYSLHIAVAFRREWSDQFEGGVVIDGGHRHPHLQGARIDAVEGCATAVADRDIQKHGSKVMWQQFDQKGTVAIAAGHSRPALQLHCEMQHLVLLIPPTMADICCEPWPLKSPVFEHGDEGIGELKRRS
eukprot:2024497-Rhodomonas_salina.1